MDSFEAAQDEGQDKGSGSAESVPIVEEGLVVGKAKFATGGVRVTSSVEELPVEETVTLREERVSAEQRPADRELTADEAEAAFEEKTVEVIGTTEEAKVSKEARVVGEVAVGKTVEEREETVRDDASARPTSRSRKSAPRPARASKRLLQKRGAFAPRELGALRRASSSLDTREDFTIEGAVSSGVERFGPP